MKIHVLTLFPGSFDSFFAHSMMKRAVEKKAANVSIHDLRRWTHDRHKTCDDKPFGGGPGMLLKPEPIFEAVDELFGSVDPKKKKSGFFAKRRTKKLRFIYLTPQGRPFDQGQARSLAKASELVFLCGHYEGVDERVIQTLVTDEISIGDYVLTQGELAAMVVMDTVIRLLPGVVGNDESKAFESFSGNLLEYPQYTRPAIYRDLRVPPVLLSGDHKRIAEWREAKAYERTLERRPDLLKKAGARVSKSKKPI